MLKYKRVFLVGGIAVLVVLFFTTGLHRHLSLESVKTQQSRLQEAYHQHPMAAIAVFSAIYIPVVALNLPGALVLGLAAGALFGVLTGTIIISFASSIGASLACLLSRYLLRDWVQRRFGEKLEKVNAGIQTEGAFYLFALRLMPVIPFFVINLVMGLTSMRLRTFYWVSQLGMLPGTMVFVNAGSQIGRIESISGILSPGLIVSLALLGIFPLLMRRLLQLYRRRWHKGSEIAPLSTGVIEKTPPMVETRLKDIRERCTECGACSKACAFLSHYGTPRAITEGFDFSSPRHQAVAYECSLCSLCTAVCPEKLDPCGLFLEIRRHHVDGGHFDESKYAAILGYEKLGTSSLFSWYGLPQGCDTVFFPGCTLPGTRPEVTMRLFQDLQKAIPAVGMVLDCCAKPSHDLGRQAHFKTEFGELTDYLSDHGVKLVLVACPNCYTIFQQYGNGLSVSTVYETIHANGFRATMKNCGREVGVHDPCALRSETKVHQAVRGLLSELGLTVQEMKHRGRRTLCCGKGGMAGFVNPALANAWSAIREQEAAGQTMVTYCAGCTGSLGRVAPTIHIADLLYRPEMTLNGNLKITRPPLTYLNRLLLKQRLKRELKPQTSRVRPRKIG
ncbi:MAG: VTT domain-containing protein [Desulfohalobiaceae bacterium]|nr:VTT domain-containing protein [Desulfohalobiaceae bacterium]